MIGPKVVHQGCQSRARHLGRVTALALLLTPWAVHAQEPSDPPAGPAPAAPATDPAAIPGDALEREPVAPAAESAQASAAAQAGLGGGDSQARYVVWRIKAGTGGGAAAPRLERALRKEMEDKLGPLMLSKAAQGGIILVRPELADCDANLPCALDVAEALSIRFVVGGEAEVVADTRITAWVIDRERATEVRRATVSVQGSGREAEAEAVKRLAEMLVVQERLGAAEDAQRAAVKRAEEDREAAATVPAWRRMVGSALVAAGGGLAFIATMAGVAGAALLAGGIALAVLRDQYRTRSAQGAMIGTLVGGGGAMALAVLFLLCALPLVALGVMAFAGVP